MRHHLPGLSALRAIAALVVVTVHLEMEKKDRGIPSGLDAAVRWVPDHHLGVVLFFVLSGFLITWLLVRERERAGRIDLRAFYIRRVLRIWPLYYLVLLISWMGFPFKVGWATLLLCVTGFPNVAKALDIGWTASPQIWSIGVEEQFYFVWPWLLLLIPKRAVVPVLLLFFAGWSLLPLWVDHFHADIPVNEGARRAWRVFFYGAKFNSMAFGCVLGYAFAKGHGLLHRVSNKVVAYGSAFLAFGLWFSGTILPLFHDEIFTVLFGLIVLNAASGRYPAFIDRGALDFLGRISYGIYMYHWMVLLLMMSLLDHSTGMLRYNVLLHGSVVGLTILVAWLSFIGPERYFLRLKTRFERV